MGACDFYVKAKGKTAEEAFRSAVSDAKHEYGHRGYTGTIAEKYSFTMIHRPPTQSAGDFAAFLVDSGDKRVDDKWGPAGCIKIEEGEWLFFGWASS